ncbi:MAG: LiaF domain-containing protein [Ilumatobacteraceae bacterium]
MTGPTNDSTAPLPPPRHPDEPTHGAPPRRTGPSRTAPHLVGGLLLLVVGVLWLLDAAGAVDLRWRAILPAGLVVVGLAVLVLSLWGRAGELVGVGLVLTVLVVASALLPEHLSAAVGERTHRPATASELRDHYSHGIGELTIDLRDVTDIAGDTTVGASLGVGELRVRVPPELTVVVDASAGVGEVTAFDRSSGGVAVDLRESRRVDGGPVLRLELSAGIGQIEVTP